MGEKSIQSWELQSETLQGLMKITVHRNHFDSDAQAYDEIELAGMYPVEMIVPAVRNESHWHRFSTWIYIIHGELNITDSEREVTLVAKPGSRVDVPARVLHSEESSGYTVIAGMSEHPDSIEGPIDLPPAEL